MLEKFTRRQAKAKIDLSFVHFFFFFLFSFLPSAVVVVLVGGDDDDDSGGGGGGTAAAILTLEMCLLSFTENAKYGKDEENEDETLEYISVIGIYICRVIRYNIICSFNANV